MLLNATLGIAFLVAGIYFMLKSFGISPSLKMRDKHNKRKPIDDSSIPPNIHQ